VAREVLGGWAQRGATPADQDLEALGYKHWNCQKEQREPNGLICTHPGGKQLVGEDNAEKFAEN
jgi:hypothetical protein